MCKQFPAKQGGRVIICFVDFTVAALTQHYFAAAALAGLVCIYGDSPPIEAA